MKKEIIIDSYGLGHAAAIIEDGKIIDCFIDPPLSVDFYPPNTFVRASIDRKLSIIGGYFVKLPSGKQGFLKSKNKYNEGNSVLLLSQIIHETNKPQIFTDVLKKVSKYFIVKIGKPGFSFSKKLSKNYDKLTTFNILKEKIEKFNDIFVICRASVATICLQEFHDELEKAITHLRNITQTLEKDPVYFDGLARKVALEKYEEKDHNIIEGNGIFERMGLWDQLEEIKQGKVHLKTGEYIIFEQTSAFLTIDVNSGVDFGVNKENINMRAVSEIFRIIRVCGFGGKIVIDFLPCSEELRKEIHTKILKLFSKDPVTNKIWGWTKSRIFELERKREKIPLKLLF